MRPGASISRSSPPRLRADLERRAEKDLLRSLRSPGELIDFCSNDYLGFARSEKLRNLSSEFYAAQHRLGSTGSRLLSGQSSLFEELEELLANFHASECALIFNSGFDANIGIFQAIPGRKDTILYDQLIHASVKSGIRLSLAKSFSYRHNDLADLETKLRAAKGCCYVATESIFSMDGDLAPLTEIAQLSSRYGAYLIVDEAHAGGIFGARGEGRVKELNLEKTVFLRLQTFGKALGAHGAAVLGSKLARDYLVNFAHSFIYSTALPSHTLCCVKAAYQELARSTDTRDHLWNRINFTRELLNLKGYNSSPGPIQVIPVPDSSQARALQSKLEGAGFDIRAILSPTVPEGGERLRLCLHTFNSQAEIERLIGFLPDLT